MQTFLLLGSFFFGNFLYLSSFVTRPLLYIYLNNGHFLERGSLYDLWTFESCFCRFCYHFPVLLMLSMGKLLVCSGALQA